MELTFKIDTNNKEDIATVVRIMNMIGTSMSEPQKEVFPNIPQTSNDKESEILSEFIKTSSGMPVPDFKKKNEFLPTTVEQSGEDSIFLNKLELGNLRYLFEAKKPKLNTELSSKFRITSIANRNALHQLASMGLINSIGNTSKKCYFITDKGIAFLTELDKNEKPAPIEETKSQSSDSVKEVANTSAKIIKPAPKVITNLADLPKSIAPQPFSVKDFFDKCANSKSGVNKKFIPDDHQDIINQLHQIDIPFNVARNLIRGLGLSNSINNNVLIKGDTFYYSINQTTLLKRTKNGLEHFSIVINDNTNMDAINNMLHSYGM